MGRRIFIHHSGALGDLLLSIPAIKALRETDDYIHVAGHPDAVAFLKEIGFVQEGSDADSSLFLPLFMNDEDGRVRDFLSRFDRIFVFTADTHSHFSEKVRTVAPDAGIFATIPPKGLTIHVSDFRENQITGNRIGNRGRPSPYPAIVHPLPGPSPLRGREKDLWCRGAHLHASAPLRKSPLPWGERVRLRGPELLPSPFLTVPSSHARSAREMLAKKGYNFQGPLIAVHPGSGGKRKCWRIENYFRLIEEMMGDMECFFLIFTGPAEDRVTKERMEDFTRHKSRIIHVGDAALVTVAALLSLSSLYVGNDSGITHLAGALNANVVALFGPTDPRLWGPVGDCVHVVFSRASDGSLSSVTVGEVLGRIKAALCASPLDSNGQR